MLCFQHIFPDISFFLCRLIIKVGSDPGRTSLEMLGYICALEVYFYPGFPNTTHVSQEIDQNYGLFNAVFKENLEVLSQARFDKDETLVISNLPLIVFGGEDNGNEVVMQDSVLRAFSIK